MTMYITEQDRAVQREVAAFLQDRGWRVQSHPDKWLWDLTAMASSLGKKPRPAILIEVKSRDWDWGEYDPKGGVILDVAKANDIAAAARKEYGYGTGAFVVVPKGDVDRARFFWLNEMSLASCKTGVMQTQVKRGDGPDNVYFIPEGRFHPLGLL
jgi:hypothetical protein